MHNLRHAFPEKTEAELQEIAVGMWGNMARLVAEYVFLEQIFDYDPDDRGKTRPARSRRRGNLRSADGREKRPRIFFTAHTGNFELLPICAATFGLEVTALFRPPNNPYIAKKVLEARRTNMGGLIPSKAGAVWALANQFWQTAAMSACWSTNFPWRRRRVDFFGRTALDQPAAAAPCPPV